MCAGTAGLNFGAGGAGLLGTVLLVSSLYFETGWTNATFGDLRVAPGSGRGFKVKPLNLPNILLLLMKSTSFDGLNKAEFMSSGELGDEGTIVCVDPVLRDESLFILLVDLKQKATSH